MSVWYDFFVMSSLRKKKHLNIYKNKVVEWIRFYASDGTPFYYCAFTHETRWEIRTLKCSIVIVDSKSVHFTRNHSQYYVIHPPIPAIERPFKNNNILKYYL